jgi:hypothetical protein
MENNNMKIEIPVWTDERSKTFLNNISNCLWKILDGIGYIGEILIINLPRRLNNAPSLFKLIFGIISNITLFLISGGSLEGSFIGGDVYLQFLLLLIPELFIFFASVSYKENSYITAILNGFCYAIPFSVFIIFGLFFIVTVGYIGLLTLLGSLSSLLAICIGLDTIQMVYLLIKTKASKLNKFYTVCYRIVPAIAGTCVLFALSIFGFAFGIYGVYLTIINSILWESLLREPFINAIEPFANAICPFGWFF